MEKNDCISTTMGPAHQKNAVMFLGDDIYLSDNYQAKKDPREACTDENTHMNCDGSPKYSKPLHSGLRMNYN
uniref:Uncharacterized protein n=1 Tax=viral metagenome TaxID=1070528 RepID=A0A6C0JTB9_9ZZZZ